MLGGSPVERRLQGPGILIWTASEGPSLVSQTGFEPSLVVIDAVRGGSKSRARVSLFPGGPGRRGWRPHLPGRPARTAGDGHGRGGTGLGGGVAGVRSGARRHAVPLAIAGLGRRWDQHWSM